MKCEHAWVYADKIYCSLPPQRDRICSKCGKKECVQIGIKRPFEDTYDGIVEKFIKLGLDEKEKEVVKK